ncbi:hypothetical protein BDF19DRAFT_432754 [Syncephalis fuscata]|nr:hypothetical protein BDF19DRAFT_432754 [Syncephalis fuscata]
MWLGDVGCKLLTALLLFIVYPRRSNCGRYLFSITLSSLAPSPTAVLFTPLVTNTSSVKVHMLNSSMFVTDVR